MHTLAQARKLFRPSLLQSNLVFTVLLAVMAIVPVLTGCGGGGSTGGGGSSTPPPPPSTPDFSILVPSSVQLQQNGAPVQWGLSVGFNGSGTATATISFPNLPAGIAVAPSSPVTVTTDTAVEFFVYATSSAAVGSGTITVQGTNASYTHTYPVALTVTQQAPFQLQLSPSSLSLTAGGSGQVQATLVPTSSTAPAPTFGSIGASSVQQRQDLDFPQISYVSSTSATMTFSADYASPTLSGYPVFITAQSTSGDTNTSTVILPISVSNAFPTVNPANNRSTAVHTDEDPQDVVYDEARKLLFLAIPGLNQVRVLSSTDYHLVATIPVPQYQSVNPVTSTIDEAVDGSAVYVGGTGEITTINPSTLQVTGFIAVPQSGGLSLGFTQVAALSTGNVLVLNGGSGHVFLWNPSTGSMTPNDAQNMTGAASMIHSGTHNRVLIFGTTANAPDGLYDAPSGSFVTVQPFEYSTNVQQNMEYPVALNPDGTQIAAAGTDQGVSIYDASFNLLPTQPPTQAGFSGYPIYSLDGSTLYVLGTKGYLGESVAYSTQTYAPEGLFTLNGAFTGGIPFAVDETGMVYGAANVTGTGQALVATDASNPGAIQEEGADVAPSFSFPYVLYNAEGFSSATVQSTIQGGGFDPTQNYQVYFGAPPASPATIPATGVSTYSSNYLQVTIPEDQTPGPANVTVTRPDGWFSIIADGVSYGSTLLAVVPNTIPSSGSVPITLIGYALTENGTLGGSPLSIQGVEELGSNGGGLYPYQQGTATAPSGTPGDATISVGQGSGPNTLTSGIHYLADQENYSLTGGVNGMVYDQPRQRLYVSSTANNAVSIFDLTAKSFGTPIPVGNAPTGLTLTADGTELAVLNSKDGTVSVIDPVQEKVIATYPVLSQAELSQVVASSITQLAPHLALIAVSGHELRLLNLDTGSLSCTGVTGCDSTGMNINPGFGPAYVSSTQNGTMAFITGSSQIALLNASQNTLTAQIGAFSQSANAVTNSDGSIFATGLAAYGGQLNLLNQMGNDIFYLGLPASGSVECLNPSGSLLFVGGNYIDVYDIHTSRLVMAISVPNLGTAQVMDETGTKIFSGGPNGITISQLATVPLSIASVTPNNGPSGTTVTIRGSGFQSGTEVEFGTTQVSATYVDGMTLTADVPSLSSGPVQITVINPNGTQYSFDAAFNVN